MYLIQLLHTSLADESRLWRAATTANPFRRIYVGATLHEGTARQIGIVFSRMIVVPQRKVSIAGCTVVPLPAMTTTNACVVANDAWCAESFWYAFAAAVWAFFWVVWQQANPVEIIGGPEVVVVVGQTWYNYSYRNILQTQISSWFLHSTI